MTENQTEAMTLALDAVKLIVAGCPMMAESTLADAIAALKKDYGDGLPELRPVRTQIAKLEIPT